MTDTPKGLANDAPAEDGFARVQKTLGFVSEQPRAVSATIRFEPAAPLTPAEKPAPLPRLTLDFAKGASPSQRLPAPKPAEKPAEPPEDLELKKLLGEGGMGRVHLARQHSLDRDVAVKSVRPEIASPAATKGLLDEAKIVGSLEHPNILPVHMLGADESGAAMLVMKRIEGVSWADVLADRAHPFRSESALYNGRDDLAANLEILCQVCLTVHFAHTRGVIHRDLKPENVMLGSFGEIYLMDWGIAHRTSTPAPAPDAPRTLCGTPAYMAPEMAEGAVPDARTDVYLLGAILHEVLTGQHRHQGETIEEALRNAWESKPFAYGQDVPEELASLCNRATSRAPSARPATALEFMNAVREFLTHRGAVTLEREARARLDELVALLNREGAAVDPARYARLGTECRFGFAQALKAWPEGARAREGLQRALTVLAKHELDRDNAAGARVLIAELPDPDPALEARVAEVDRAHAERAAREQQSRALEREMDTSVGAKQRAMLAAAAVILGVGLTLYVRLSGADALSGGREEKHAILLRLWLVVMVAVAAVGVAARRALLQNVASRRMLASIAVAMVGVLVHRVLGLFFVAPVSVILAGDLLILGAALVVAGVNTVRELAIAGVVLALGAPVIVRFPWMGGGVFGAATVVGLAIAGVGWLRAAKPPAAT